MSGFKKLLATTKYTAKSILMQDTRKKVNLFIIGEQKCGTTSLFSLLTYNQSVLGAANKECHYFNSTKFEQDINFKNYHHCFRHTLNHNYAYLVDASPDYLSDNSAYNRIYDYNPKAKIIVILRNPVSRFISAYNFYFSNIIQNLDWVYNQYFQYTDKGRSEYQYLKQHPAITIENFLNDEIDGKSPLQALSRGKYFSHIRKWQQCYGIENLCLVSFEHFIDSITSRVEIKKLEGFLQLTLNKSVPYKNISMKKKTVSEKVLQTLEAIYRPEMEIMYSIFNKPEGSGNVYSIG